MTHVLLVDDRDDNLEYLRALLQGNGFQVQTAYQGAEALQMARTDPPMLIISDLLMPVMDGYTLLRHWKSDPLLRGIPFVVYTATYTEPEDERLALNLGADAFLLKPTEPDDFLAQMRAVLAKSITVTPSPVNQPHGEDSALLKQYSETLIRKLEERTRQLEESNRALQSEIAERSEIERRLRESQEQSLLLLNSTAEGIYGLDVNGVCTFCNPAAARLLGFENPEELVGQFAHLHHHHSRIDGTPFPTTECRVHHAFPSGAETHAEDEVFFRKNATHFPVEYWAHPIRRGPDIVGAVVAFLDISERRNLEARFLQSQRMEAVGRLAGGVAHDFNNTLQVVITCSELLDGLLADRKKEREYIRDVQAAAQRGASLTHQLLAFSRNQVLRPAILDLNSVVREIQEMLQRMIGEDIRLTIDCDPRINAIEADGGKIEQILMNLAVNSRDAMPQGGELIISTSNVEIPPRTIRQHPSSEGGNYVLLSVRDTGCGMDEATRSRIFEPFFTTKDAGKGTGLGLSTVYGIVSQSGGFIDVESEPGQGSRFDIRFPSVEGSAAPPAVRERSDRASSGTESILLIEDESSLRKLIGETLRACGYSVLEAQDGQAGVALAEHSGVHIDLLVSDVILPDISGPQVAKQLLASRPSIKVLYISGYTDDYLSHRGISQDEPMLLEKPFSIGSLLAKIRSVLDR
jgi:two-component system, cell cycle sensor histidine kinase and response regulator CckA